MSSSSPNPGARLALVLGFLVVAALATIVIYERLRHRATVTRLVRERNELESRVEARDLTITQLKSEVRNLRSLLGTPAPPRPAARSASPLPAEAELRRQIADLQASHSNTLALAGSLLTDKSSSEAEEEARRTNAEVLAELESASSEAAQNAETARQRTEELLDSLKVPADVEALSAESALATPDLRSYWPYFEARREHDILERVAEALRLRLIQETASTAPAGEPP